MILTDRINTLTVADSDDKAEPIINSSSIITIGGVVKSQADSQRLKIVTRMRLTQAQVRTLTSIIKNFAAELYFTPQRLLWDKTSIAEMRVILASPPSIEERLITGTGTTPSVVFWVALELEEVL